MKIVVVSPFWNAGKLVEKSIKSLKNQYYTNFVAYYIDDMSTDDSYDIAKKTIGDDERFILIKNTEKKYKTKNFIDIIKNQNKIDWDDVIVELDGDDCLYDNYVLGLLNKIYTNDNIWICGSRWVDKNGKSMKYGRADADNPRSKSWNFSHLRTFRAFLFWSIKDEDLKFNGEYFKAACDLGHGMPMLEMAGNEHYYYLDQVTYLYNWHDNQSYSNNNSFGDKTLQGKIAKHIYGSKRYKKLIFSNKVLDFIKENQKPVEKKLDIVVEQVKKLEPIIPKKVEPIPVIKKEPEIVKQRKNIYQRVEPQRKANEQQPPVQYLQFGGFSIPMT